MPVSIVILAKCAENVKLFRCSLYGSRTTLSNQRQSDNIREKKKRHTGRMIQMEKISGRIRKIMYRERLLDLGRTAAIVLAAALIGL